MNCFYSAQNNIKFPLNANAIASVHLLYSLRQLINCALITKELDTCETDVKYHWTVKNKKKDPFSYVQKFHNSDDNRNTFSKKNKSRKFFFEIISILYRNRNDSSLMLHFTSIYGKRFIVAYTFLYFLCIFLFSLPLLQFFFYILHPLHASWFGWTFCFYLKKITLDMIYLKL